VAIWPIVSAHSTRREGLAAAFRYAADVLKGEHVWDLKTTA
jgi:hypothetical protein